MLIRSSTLTGIVFGCVRVGEVRLSHMEAFPLLCRCGVFHGLISRLNIGVQVRRLFVNIILSDYSLALVAERFRVRNRNSLVDGECR